MYNEPLKIKAAKVRNLAEP